MTTAPRTRRLLVRSLLALPLALGAPSAHAQGVNSSLSALQDLGRRAQSIRLSIKDAPTVVLVPDERAFADAVARWSLERRFPILIDDGSTDAHERIGRFVRAYKPANVVRWQGEKDRADEPVRAHYERALAASWDSDSVGSMQQVWSDSNFSPLGAVVVAEDDPAWVAGLALASGRGELTVWSEGVSRPVGAMMKPERLEKLDSDIRAALTASGRTWEGLGDEIDAITLCMTRPSRYKEAEEPMAVTDRIGRHGPGRRYAYAGMIFGDASQASYAAMCALFLQPESAWMFDGYSPEFAPPYAVAQGVQVADQNAWRTLAFTPPTGSATTWRSATISGINAGFVHVNTSGRFDRFDVAPGSLYGHDVPALELPAIVHFIHSFSAQRIGTEGSIAGRWLVNGAYVYVGSMDEPFLNAFLPVDRLLNRAFASMPLGGAARADARKTVWKINYFGDPLMVLGPPAPRTEEKIVLEGATDLLDEMRTSARARELAVAASTLVMLGRASEAVKLASAAKRLDNQGADSGDRGNLFDPALARAAIASVYRAGERELFLDLTETLILEGDATGLDLDRAWTVIRPMLPSTDRALIVRTLSEHIRGASPVEDVSDLAPAVARLLGADAARAMFDRAIENTKAERDVKELRRLARRYRATPTP